MPDCCHFILDSYHYFAVTLKALIAPALSMISNSIFGIFVHAVSGVL